MPPKKSSDQSSSDELSNEQLQLAITRLSQDLRETNNRIDHQLELQRSENHSQINELKSMMEQFLRQQTSRQHQDIPETSTSKIPQEGNTGSPSGSRTPNNQARKPFLERNSGYNQVNHEPANKMTLPRIDFPIFNGQNPSLWKSKCDNYFDIFTTSEDMKSKMAILHFTDDALEWFDCFKLENPHPPWQELVREVFDRFQVVNDTNPVEEFMQVVQTDSVDDYIKRFQKAKARVIHETKVRDSSFFLLGFIGRLKEELRHTVELFNPLTLNQAYRCAKKVELALEGQEKRMKPQKAFSTSFAKPPFAKDNTERRWNQPPNWSQNKTPRKLTIEEKRAKGLCYYCDEKYTAGHKCKNKGLHAMEGQEEDGPEEGVSEEEPENTSPEQEEHAVISMCSSDTRNSSDKKNHKTLKFKGTIQNVPIYALIDSGSSHSFLNPEIAYSLGLEIDNTNPLKVHAVDSLLVTNKICKNVSFELQGYSFSADLRLLAVDGYDIILGIDWLSEFGLMSVHWRKGIVYIQHAGQRMILNARNEQAELKLSDQQVNLVKEVKQGSELLVAQLFCLSTTEENSTNVHEDSVHQVLTQFSDVFSEPKGLPPKRTLDHQIPLKDNNKIVNLRPYRFSYFQRLEVEKIIEELLANSLIQPSTSSFASPILLVKKKDQTWRLCVDYRQLNDNTLKNKYPIPIVEDLLDELQGAKFFSKLDLRSGYHQIRMHEPDIHKTAFRTHEGLYEYRVMPFGLTNAPATFQSLMNSIFKPYLRKFVLVFFDDILVYSKDLDTHMDHLYKALQLLRQNQLFAKLNKCVFATQKVEYLGFVISHLGVATDPSKISAMQNWPEPKNVKGLRGFLGLTGYYRKFIRNYGIISKPLTDQLKKDSFCWNSTAQSAFEELKQAMTQAPVLALPDFSQPFVIETDACNTGIGAVLMQNKRPIAFLSKKLGIKNQSLSTYEKELLALFTAVSKWKHYLIGNPFIIRTDQISLKHLLEQKLHTAMQHKGISKLLGLDYTIEYKKGSSNAAADALSRQNLHNEDNCNTSATIYALTEIIPQWVTDIKSSYVGDQWAHDLIEQAQQGTNPKFQVHQGILRYKSRICVGSNGDWRNTLLKEVHDSAQGGHSGINTTYHRLKQMFYWPRMKEMVYQYIISCNTCQLNKPEHVPSPGLLQPLPIPEEAWTNIGMDFITGLPKSKGREVIMVVIDRFTKYGHFILLSHPYTASTVAQAFLDNVYKLHGLPTNIVSDRDPIFLSKFWEELFDKLGVQLNLSTAYHPQTDGQTERLNQCLENYLRVMSFHQPKKWAKWISLAEWWYNTCQHSATKLSPFQALYGYSPTMLPLGDFPKGEDEAVNTLLKDRQAMLRQLKKNLQQAQDRMKKYADLKRVERSFSVGDWVYLKLQPYRQISITGVRNQKLSSRFYGPFEILERIGSVAYRLALPVGSEIHPVIHVSQLKKHIKRDQPVMPQLPILSQSGGFRLEPAQVHARRLVRQRGSSTPQLLVSWSNTARDDTSWENYHSIEEKFPDLILEGKNCPKEGGMSSKAAKLVFRTKEKTTGSSFESKGERAGAKTTDDVNVSSGQPNLSNIGQSGAIQRSTQLPDQGITDIKGLGQN